MESSWALCKQYILYNFCSSYYSLMQMYFWAIPDSNDVSRGSFHGT